MSLRKPHSMGHFPVLARQKTHSQNYRIYIYLWCSDFRLKLTSKSIFHYCVKHLLCQILAVMLEKRHSGTKMTFIFRQSFESLVSTVNAQDNIRGLNKSFKKKRKETLNYNEESAGYKIRCSLLIISFHNSVLLFSTKSNKMLFVGSLMTIIFTFHIITIITTIIVITIIIIIIILSIIIIMTTANFNIEVFLRKIIYIYDFFPTGIIFNLCRTWFKWAKIQIFIHLIVNGNWTKNIFLSVI